MIEIKSDINQNVLQLSVKGKGIDIIVDGLTACLAIVDWVRDSYPDRLETFKSLLVQEMKSDSVLGGKVTIDLSHRKEPRG